MISGFQIARDQVPPTAGSWAQKALSPLAPSLRCTAVPLA